MIRDNILLYGDYRALHVSCYSCGQGNHSVSTCPYINLGLLKDVIIRKHLHSVNQRRARHKSKPRPRKKVNVLKSIKLIAKSAEPFLLEDEEVEEMPMDRHNASPSSDMIIPNEDGTINVGLPKIEEDSRVEDDQIQMKNIQDSSPSPNQSQNEFENLNFEFDKKNTGMFGFGMQPKMPTETYLEKINFAGNHLDADSPAPSPGFRRLGPRKNTAGASSQEEIIFNFKNIPKYEHDAQSHKTNGTQKLETPSAKEFENFARSIFQRYQRRNQTHKSTITMNNSEFDLMTEKVGTEKNEEMAKEVWNNGFPRDFTNGGATPGAADYGRSWTKKTNESRTKTSKSAVTAKTNKTQNTSNNKKKGNLKEEQRLFMIEMDTCKVFSSYFPKNNMDNVISQIVERQALISNRQKTEGTIKFKKSEYLAPMSPLRNVRGRSTVLRKNFFVKRNTQNLSDHLRINRLGSFDSKISKKTNGKK